MRKNLTRSIIVLLSFMAFERIIGAEDEDDVALAKINDLFFRSNRRISKDDVSETFNDSNIKRELESKLNDLPEVDPRTGTTKRLVVRQDDEEESEITGITASEVSPLKRFNPVDKDEEEGGEESVEYADDEDSETQDTTKNPVKLKNKYAGLAHRIGKKLIDRKIKFTISLPVAIVVVGSIILLTCCCSLYLRNRLVACINSLPGRKKKKKSKMLAVDTERGRWTPRRKKRREKSISFSKNRARSLSQDMVNIGTQKSVTTTRDMEEPSSTTGCYQCCQKKQKRGKQTKR